MNSNYRAISCFHPAWLGQVVGRLFIIVILVFGISINGRSQSAIQWIEDPTGNYSVDAVIDLSANGKVVLVRLQPGYVPAIWDSLNGFQPLGLASGWDVDLSAISSDGSVVVGYQDLSNPSRIMAFRWVKNSGIQYLPPLPGVASDDTISLAYCVNGDGSMVGGYSINSEGVECATTWVGKEPTNLNPYPPYGYSFCKAISDSGNIQIVDAKEHYGPTHLVRWAKGEWQSLMTIPSSWDNFTIAGVTATGDTILGYCDGFPFRWTPAQVDTLTMWPQAMSRNGLRFIGYGAICDSGNTTYTSLREKCENEFGIDLGGEEFYNTPGISADGSVIAGQTYNGKAFRLILRKQISILRPTAIEKYLIGGIQDTIILRAPRGVDTVDIYYSPDSGKTRVLISKEYQMQGRVDSVAWQVPDTVSQDCMIIAMATNDTMIRGESPIFTIRGHWLLRTNPTTNRYDLFDLAKHGWQFPNKSTEVWPNAWWGQFAYQGGQDPYTNDVYPDRDPFKHAKASDFIDWPLFVRTMGEEECYYLYDGQNTTIYKGAAESFWEAQKEKWGGSCYGFAISTLLAFDMPESFRSSFPGMPPFNDPPNRYFLCDFGVNDSIRLIINSLMFSQNGNPHKSYFDNKFVTTTPKQTVAELQEMFLSDERNDKSLSLFPPNATGGHEIVAYRVVNDPRGSSEFKIYVDDSNIPTNKNAFVHVDTTTDRWSYSHLTNKLGVPWGGGKGLTLDDPVSLYTQSPKLPKGISTPSLRRKSIFLAQDSTWKVYLPSEADILITDGAGRSLGVVADSLVWEIPDAVPMKPGSTTSAPPGYILPKGEYSVTVGPFRDSNAVFKLVTDTLIYTYRRYGITLSDIDQFHLGSDGFMVKNFDQAVKTFNIEAIIPAPNDSGERRILFSGLTSGNGDSIQLQLNSPGNPVVKNLGSLPTSYDISLFGCQYREGVGYDQQKFLHKSVTLDPNSTHSIHPLWDNLTNQSLEIQVDIGNDGTIDSTVTIDDQTLGVNEGRTGVIPHSYALEQNYPNPFNPMTNIKYAIVDAGSVSLTIYDVLGREVATLVDQVKQPGEYTVTWDASRVPSGVYYYRLIAGHFVATKKMVLMR